jgi:hypothetical protein
MIYIGKGLATIGCWAGCCILGFLGLAFYIGPIIALYLGVVGTVAIWSPKDIKKLIFWD